MQASAVLELQVDSSGAVSGMQKFDQAAKTAKSSSAELMGVLTSLAAAFALYKMESAAKDVTELAARYQTLGVVMDVIGRTAGYSAGQMANFQQGLQKTGISMIESRENLIKMAQAHVKLGDANKLARIAQDAAVIGNINSSEAFGRMITAVQEGNVLMLRTIGINVNFQEAYKKGAPLINKQVSELTEADKVQMRVNAVMAKGIDIAGAYEAAMGTAGKQLKSTQRYLEDMKVAIGQAFLPEYTAAVFAFANALKWLGENANLVSGALVGIGVAIAALTVAVKADSIMGAIIMLANPVLLAGLIAAAAALGSIAVIFGTSAVDAALARKEASEFTETLKHLGADSLRHNIAQTQEQIIKLQTSMAWRGSTPAAVQHLAELTDKLQQYEKALKLVPLRPQNVAAKATDGKEADKFRESMDIKTEELSKNKMLADSFGVSSNELKKLTIVYDAHIERAKNAKTYKGEELKQMNALTGEIEHQKLRLAELQSVEAQRSAVRDASRTTDVSTTKAQQELQLMGLSAAQASKKRMEFENTNKTLEAQFVLHKSLEGASESEERTARRIYQLSLDQIDAENKLAIAVRNATDAAGTATIKERREAITKETDALISGVSSRAGYQIDLSAELETKKAIATVVDPVLLANRIQEIELLREAEQAHRKVEDAMAASAKQNEQLLKQAGKILNSSLSSFFMSVVTDGKNAFQSLWDNVKSSFFRMVSDILTEKAMGRIGGLLVGIMGSASAANAQTGYGATGGGPSVPWGTMGANDKSGPSGGSVAMGRAGAGIAGLGVGYGIGNTLYSSSRGAAGNYAVGALGGAAAGAATGFAMAGPVGAAIGAVTGLIGGILGIGSAAKEAAKQMALMQKAVELSMAALRASVAGDSVAQGTASINAEREAQRKAIEDAYQGGGADSEQVRKRNAALAEMNSLEDKRIQMLKDEYAITQKRAFEDLKVRLLVAQGRNTEADRLRLDLAQQREMQDAIKNHADAATLALLAQVQAQEKIAAATNATNSAMLNTPQGFKLARERFEATAPLGQMTVPVTPTTSTPTGGAGTVVVLKMDSREVARGVVKQFRRASAGQGNSTIDLSQIVFN
jgi:hypothetical protein